MFLSHCKQIIPLYLVNTGFRRLLEKKIASRLFNSNLPDVYYLSSKTSSIITSFPLIYPPKNARSRIMYWSDKERLLLKETSLLADELREIILIHTARLLYLSYQIPDLNHFFKYNLPNIFAPIADYKKSFNLYNILDDKKEITLIQSLMTYIWGNRKFDYHYLEQYCSTSLNCQSYEKSDIYIGVAMEATICKRVLKLSSANDYPLTRTHLVNADKLLSQFSVVSSRQSVNQNHADILMEQVSQQNLYFEIKSYSSNGMGNSRLSLFFGNKINYLREINNILTTFKEALKNPKFNHMTDLKNIVNKLALIKRNYKDPQKQFKEMFNILLTVIKNPGFSDLKLNLAFDIHTDEHFGLFYKGYIKPLIDKEKTTTDFLADLFPKDSVILDKDHETNIKKLITKLFPEDLSITLKNNFDNLMQKSIDIL